MTPPDASPSDASTPETAAIELTAAPREATCLDYANTRMYRGSAAPVEQFAEWPTLLDWIAGTGALRAEAAAELRAWADANPDGAAALFAAAIALRELVYRVFSAVASNVPVAEADLTALNQALAEAPLRVRLARLGGVYIWRIEHVGLSAPALLAP